MKKYYEFLSTPIYAYIIAIIFTGVMFGISSIFEYDTLWNNLFVNLGCGIMSSTVVSLLIDFGATKRKQAQDKSMLSHMSADLMNECSELPSQMYTAVYEAFGYSIEGKYTFTEWTEKLFSGIGVNHNQKQISEIKYMLQTVSEIKMKSRELIKVMKLSRYNECVTEERIKEIKRIINVCDCIEREQWEEKYNKCKCIIIEKLVPLIKKAFGEISVEFERKYNEEDYI